LDTLAEADNVVEPVVVLDTLEEPVVVSDCILLLDLAGLAV
jgi:hypothetical protein